MAFPVNPVLSYQVDVRFIDAKSYIIELMGGE